jgi:hypothetical protein
MTFGLEFILPKSAPQFKFTWTHGLLRPAIGSLYLVFSPFLFVPTFVWLPTAFINQLNSNVEIQKKKISLLLKM